MVISKILHLFGLLDFVDLQMVFIFCYPSLVMTEFWGFVGIKLVLFSFHSKI